MYESDLSDAEWNVLAPFFPSIDDQWPKPGRPRDWSFRTILNAIFYLNKTGCQWRMLPSDFPPWSTVYDYYRQWQISGLWETIHTALRREVRIKVGKNPEPTAACIDSQTVKTALADSESKGYDGGKQIDGRKRHIIVDTLGLLLVVLVHPASISDSLGGQIVLVLLNKCCRTIKKVWGDCGYRGYLEEWYYRCRPKRELEITKRPQGKFVVQAKRWVVERTFGWFVWARRLSKDYERLPRNSEACVYICMIRIMVRRLV